MKNKSLCRHIPLIVLPIKTYNSMIYSNFSAKTLKTILTRLQIVCICFTTVDENKPYTIWNIILNKIRLSPKGISYEQPLTLKQVARPSIFGDHDFFWRREGHVILIPEIFFWGKGQVILTPMLTQLVLAVYSPRGWYFLVRG